MFGSVTSTWGANNNQQQPQQQQPSAFGQPSTGFGTSGAFGSTGTSAFGQNTTQQPAANPMFGGGTTGTTGTGFGAFGNTGGTTTSAFGAPKPATGFGAFGGGGTSTGTSAFGGGGTGAFGQGNTSTTGTTGTGLFGQPASNTTSAFGSGGGIFGAAKAPSTFGAAAGTSTTPQPITTGSSNPPFAVHQEKDPSNSTLTLQYQSISCMPAYANTSVEELRVQDYAQGRKTAGAATGGFGQTSAFGSTTTQPATTGLFGQPAPATQSAFAPAATTNTGTTGGFGAFGSNTNTTTQPASTSIFGGGTTGTSAFGQPQQQQNQPATTGFGAFGSTQQQQPTTSIFGGGANTTTSAFGSNAPKPGGFGAFGSTNTGTTTGGFGTSAFGQQNQQNQQQPTTGLFGNTAQPAATTTGFGAFGATTNQNQTKPLFGATNPTQPAATGFGAFGATQQQNQQQQQPQQGSIFGGGLFGNQPQQQPQQGTQPATTSLFGNTNTTTNPAGGGGIFGGGLFGNTQNQQQQQQQQPAQGNLFGGGGLFGNKPAATGSIFGSTPAATNPAPTTGLFGSTLGQQPAATQNTGFSGGLFGNKPPNAMNTSMSTGQSGGLFGSNAGNTGGLFGTSTTNGPAQGTLTASIAQPIIGSDLAIFDMLGPGPRTLNLDDSTTKKKAGFFVDVPIRAPVPRSGAYTPANSKLRGFGTSVNGSLGSSALSFSSGSPNALSFSRAGDGRSSADPLALMRSGSSPALGSGARQSVKKVILDKKVEPTELFRKSGSPGIPGGKIVFSPALSIAAREKEAREALAASNGIQDSPTPAARKQHTPNRFTAQPTQNVSGDGSTDQGAGELEEGDYWVKPDLATLKKTGFDELSSFSGLVIGKVGYGEIHFLEPVDLTGLPKLGMLLGEVVRFDDKECSVYPDNDEAEKPPPGSGLNVKARLILYRCWAMDKATREPIKDPSHPAAVKHVKRLKHMKETQFEDFDWKEGKWTFTFITPELAQGHEAATKRGAIEGAVGSSIAALGGSYYLHKRYPGYRALPLSLKVLGVVIVVAPVLTIQAERRGYQFDKAHWEGETKRLIDVKELAEEQRWENLSTRDRIAEWADKHQYSLILGGWASSLAFAGAIIQRDRLQTTAQKIVQARMWAQGLTIGLMIVAGALTQSKRLKNQNHTQTDHSWRDILEQQERERQELERSSKEGGRSLTAVAAA